MTLIALIITIIVLLILAGVSISMVAGDNGILTQAVNAADSNNLAEVKSDLSLALASCQTNYFADRYGDGGSDVQVASYFKTTKIKTEMGDDYSSVTGTITIGSASTLTITKTSGNVYTATVTITDNGGVTVSSVTDSGTSSGSVATDSFVGYYADINADGVVDGVIYADLLIGRSGTWNDDSWSSYSYDAIDSSSVKDYYVIQESYTGDFGTADVLAPTGSGADRFYVMALKDVNTGTCYCWYYAAYGSLDKIVSYDTNDFGEGRTNSKYVMDKWDTEEWGAQDDNGTYLDLWGVIKSDYDNGWFVPSKSEWACFGDAFSISSDNYGLSAYYWTSSQSSTYSAFSVASGVGIAEDFVDDDYLSVRLSTTF